MSFVIAPMEDVTDVVFRHVVNEAGRPDVFFTEYTNSDSYCHPEGMKSVRGRLIFTEDEQPMVAHIWGDNPEYFRQISIGMAELGFKGIDINMGCPVPNMVSRGKGSGLILGQDVAAELIQAAKAGGAAGQRENKAWLHGCRGVAGLANSYFKTGYCEPFYSFTNKKGNERSRCALGADSGDKETS